MRVRCLLGAVLDEVLAAASLARIKGVSVSVVTATVRPSRKLHAHAALECGVGLGNGGVNANARIAGVNRARVAVAALCVVGACQGNQLEVERPAVQLGDGERQVGVVGTDRQMTRKRHRLVVRAAVVESRLSGALEALVAQRLVSGARALNAARASLAHGDAALGLGIVGLARVDVADRLALSHSAVSHFDAVLADSTIRDALVGLARLTREAILV